MATTEIHIKKKKIQWSMLHSNSKNSNSSEWLCNKFDLKKNTVSVLHQQPT